LGKIRKRVVSLSFSNLFLDLNSTLSFTYTFLLEWASASEPEREGEGEFLAKHAKDAEGGGEEARRIQLKTQKIENIE